MSRSLTAALTYEHKILEFNFFNSRNTLLQSMDEGLYTYSFTPPTLKKLKHSFDNNMKFKLYLSLVEAFRNPHTFSTTFFSLLQVICF